MKKITDLSLNKAVIVFFILAIMIIIFLAIVL